MFFRFLDRHSLRFHLKVALLLGLIFRALCAYFAYGPLAMDDYIDGVSPALQWARGEVPHVSPGRSHLLVWFLGVGIKIGNALGFDGSVVTQVRFLYLFLGIFSLSLILSAYRFVKTRDKRFAALFLYLLSLHAIMPFAGTRAFGEAVAMPFVLAGVLSVSPFFSGLWLGLATLLRFQCGLLVVLFLILWKGSPKFLGAGLVVLAIQLLVDYGSGYTPLQTLTDYIARNHGWAVEYGVQPWYTHFTTLLAFVLFPFSLTLPWKTSVREHWRIALAAIVFVVIHSLIPHKEERFLFPILPLVLGVLAAAWAKQPESLFRCAFLPLNAAALFLITFSNPQASIHEPIVEVQRRFSSGVIAETDNDLAGNWMGQGIFLKKPFAWERNLTPTRLDEILATRPEVVMVTGFVIPEWLFEHPRCREWHTAGSLTDRLLYWANPSHNVRRRPNRYGFCK